MLLAQDSPAGEANEPARRGLPGLAGLPHFAPRAKRVIFLCQSGAPSQIDLFDHKPVLAERHGEELPESIRAGQRLTTMTAEQKSKPLTPSLFKFARHGECGALVSELLPHTAKVVDRLCFLKSLHTEAINHDPGITMLQTGSQQPGRPSLGSWLSYGLGTENADLPAFVVMISGGEPGDQPLYGRLWGAGFLPALHAGVKLRGSGDPVLYLSDPPGLARDSRRRMLDTLRELNEIGHVRDGDPEILTRIEQYERAFGLQQAAPELADLSSEPASTFELYGDDAKTPGTFAANCLLARRLVERGTRFVQLYHRDWDHHTNLPSRIRKHAKLTDQASAALVSDLAQRGLLDQTLVVWGGEFGRTAYCQGTPAPGDYGRDHHPRCFTMWLAGGGIRPGFSLGQTDDFSYNIAERPIHLHDLQATILHLLGIDHERLTFRFQSRDYRLTDVAGEVITEAIC
ncbi:MAG: DUF1501 domain-containing protein [Pirellulaceae bacterium]|nr:DUF1501 domain-containing protein [Pirellulaceae bacterium]